MNESAIQALILRDLTADPAVRLFRSNTAVGWVGQLIAKLPNGRVLLGNARPLHAGLCVGSADVIGWVSRAVTVADVGRRVAVFASLEVKSARGVASPEQINWRRVVSEAGGIAGIVRSVDEARGLVR